MAAVVNTVPQKWTLKVEWHARNELLKGVFWFILFTFACHFCPKALVIQALITFPVLKTMTSRSDINIKPHSSWGFFFNAKTARWDPLFGFPATCETPCSDHVYNNAIFFFCPWTNTTIHPGLPRLTGESICNNINAVSTAKVVTCEEFGARKVQVAVWRQTIW